MQDGLDRALAEGETAISSGTAEDICHISRIVYALGVEAALTPRAWAQKKERVRRLFMEALDTDTLKASDGPRFRENLQSRLKDLEPHFAAQATVAD